jgi:hypothetical protein
VFAVALVVAFKRGYAPVVAVKFAFNFFLPCFALRAGVLMHEKKERRKSEKNLPHPLTRKN